MTQKPEAFRHGFVFLFDVDFTPKYVKYFESLKREGKA
jgi:hypothetical protein